MDTLYPNLYERFKTEGLCPVCLVEMELMPRYSCVNGHTMCHRCKPYYYGCPTCMAPLDIEIQPPPQTDAPSQIHFNAHSSMPHVRTYIPSAPSMNDFLDREKRAWESSSDNQQLEPCTYSHLGCWVKLPEHLRTLHESRCQFRPHLEEERMPTDLHHSHDDLVECSYSAVGCKVRMMPWRRSIHEKFCNYRDKFESVNAIGDAFASVTIGDNDYGGDPEELVQCKFRRYGCTVSMPRRRKYIHEQKCNYKSHQADDGFFPYPSEPELDPEEQVECRWSEHGCRVRPKRYRKQIHEDKCNYRMVECTYRDYGCNAIFTPARKYAHEGNCEFAN
ncbi:uncharacterized protein [Linepithema humile]|nr:PREDICTED: uncharacterized protein LOC105670018 isoform X3 [Linepithema humile]XP_012218719.1 PREDICTED: uncharacterized protein LOC105670018 isoform X3 [Linepithema humile]XP_012218720.1 PREDICTED: uncharacterized protein LOC105670018 isoform X3 [Linepithema humile]XP_012218722.1 PREDICTED: uncharacterized protein LOC105670018 isoform X3 [Linepithema humile]